MPAANQRLSRDTGVPADILEKRLRDILDIAETWGATLLIDEVRQQYYVTPTILFADQIIFSQADVFLEARAKHDIQRNALVSVFLRLLEYHSGESERFSLYEIRRWLIRLLDVRLQAFFSSRLIEFETSMKLSFLVSPCETPVLSLSKYILLAADDDS